MKLTAKLSLITAVLFLSLTNHASAANFHFNKLLGSFPDKTTQAFVFEVGVGRDYDITISPANSGHGFVFVDAGDNSSGIYFDNAGKLTGHVFGNTDTGTEKYVFIDPGVYKGIVTITDGNIKGLLFGASGKGGWSHGHGSPAPEPISYVLFLFGAAILALRFNQRLKPATV